MNKFREVALSINRAGVEELVNWLYNETDFEKAPASSIFHGNYIGGLEDHCYNVYEELKRLNFLYGLNIEEDSIKLVALFHDICKADFYIESTRNVKNERTGQWEKKPFFKREEKFPFGGHGSKSVFLIMQFVKLSPMEAAAINAHMGAWDKSDYADPGSVYEHNELAWLLHVADERATYFVDRKEE